MTQLDTGEHASRLDSLTKAYAARTQKDLASLQGKPVVEESITPAPPSEPLTDAQKNINIGVAANNLLNSIERAVKKSAQKPTAK